MKLRNIKLYRFLHGIRIMQRVNMALSRGAATSSLRHVDLRIPRTWEFSGFSQNGEDGIIDVLAGYIRSPNRYFVEIGASDGLENNTTWLALAKRYSGVMIEGDEDVSAWCRYWISSLCNGVECRDLFVTKDNVAELKSLFLRWDPDVFSLDVDGNDYYIAASLLEHGFRPKIAVVEYNSVFGPDLKLSVEYDPHFSLRHRGAHGLYFGCSISAWKHLFARYGYEFVTVDLNGVNAFFVDIQAMKVSSLGISERLEYQVSFSHARQYKTSWEKQFELIKDMPFTRL